MSTPSTLSMPSSALERQAVTLAADAYLPADQQLAKYPGCALIAGIQNDCFVRDRALVVRFGNTIWVACEGTHDLTTLISDFDMGRIPLPPSCGDIYPFAEVHSGFWHGLDHLWQLTLNAIDRLADGDAVEVIFLGHSRGASIAILAAWRYAQIAPARARSYASWVLAFAPARPGNAAFRAAYNTSPLGARTFCYQHGADIVPWQTPWLLGNRHVGHRVWFPDLAQSVSVPAGPCPSVRVLDPPLWKLLTACAFITWVGWRKVPPLIEQLHDHHISTYQAMLAA